MNSLAKRSNCCVDIESKDGYFVARTERVDDISLAGEERLESMETSTDGVNAHACSHHKAAAIRKQLISLDHQ
jgi:hypothetical protein